MVIYWMPYLTLGYPFGAPRELHVGNATFFEDTPESWRQVVGVSRPEHLENYRQFPERSDQVGGPVFGTLVRSSDPQWLTDHIDVAVAVLYFLGDHDRQSWPAECFAYHHIAPVAGSDGVRYWTKHGTIMEFPQSLTLYPPLATRGRRQAYRVDLQNQEHQELLRRFAANPHDRIAVAVRQYFRSQFSDIFTSTFTEDFALCCGAIEAAFEIDALQPGVGDRFAASLAQLYGDEDRFEEFFLGLYVSRSLFVHGAVESLAATSATKEAAAYKTFRSVRLKVPLIRRITREVILNSLGQVRDEFGFWKERSALPLLATVLHSSGTWQRIKSLLTKQRAADRIITESDDDFANVEELAFQIDKYFDWQCVEEEVERSHVFACIRTCAILLGRITGSAGPVYAESDALGKAVDASDESAITAWARRDPWGCVHLSKGDRQAMVQHLMRGLASFFQAS